MDYFLEVAHSFYNAPLKAKYCAEWGDWLIIETADILLQAEGEKEND